MAELKPVLNKISAFDAIDTSAKTTFTFSWKGAQSFGNIVKIHDYETQELVYENQQETMALKHILQIDENCKLENGKKYYATVYSIDRDGNASLPSKEVAFYCFKKPEFYFEENRFDSIYVDEDGSRVGQLSSNSAYLNVKYIQENAELVNEYRFTLYDSKGNLLLQTKNSYITGNEGKEEDLPRVMVNLPYTLGGVTDTEKKDDGTVNYDAGYLIKCEATTVHGMNISTQIRFVVHKNMGGVGALIRVEKLPNNVVSISSNFKIVNAELSGDEKYVYDAENNPFAIDLTETSLKYFEGFTMTDPWKMTGILTEPIPNSVLISCKSNFGEEFKISYHERNYSLVSKSYFLFEVKKQTTNYILRSNYFEIDRNKWYMVYVCYNNGYFTFEVTDAKESGYQTIDDYTK